MASVGTKLFELNQTLKTISGTIHKQQQDIDALYKENKALNQKLEDQNTRNSVEPPEVTPTVDLEAEDVAEEREREMVLLMMERNEMRAVIEELTEELVTLKNKLNDRSEYGMERKKKERLRVEDKWKNVGVDESIDFKHGLYADKEARGLFGGSFHMLSLF